MTQAKILATQALMNMRGDDLYRARAAFKRLTPSQMHQAYGQSDKTPAQIIAEYEAHDADVTAAINWLNNLKE